MSGYSSHYGLSPQSTSSPKSPNGLHHTTVKTERRSSQSSSDDGNFGHRDDKKIGEQDGMVYYSLFHSLLTHFVAEDGNSLTSQTLNADGTPKRPMNAFMIFARRRRPQVSAQNQSMRTGEISKILSREWVSMPPVNTPDYFWVVAFLPGSSRKNNFTLSKRNNSKKPLTRNTRTTSTVDVPTTPENADVLTLRYDLSIMHF